MILIYRAQLLELIYNRVTHFKRPRLSDLCIYMILHFAKFDYGKFDLKYFRICRILCFVVACSHSPVYKRISFLVYARWVCAFPIAFPRLFTVTLSSKSPSHLSPLIFRLNGHYTSVFTTQGCSVIHIIHWVPFARLSLMHCVMDRPTP